MGNVGAAVSLVPSVILDLSVMRNRLFWPRRDGERLRGSVGIQPALSRDVLCAILTSLSALHFLRGAGGGAPGWQRDAVSTRSDGRRCRAEAKDGSRDRLRWRRRHARRAESVEERWEATALRHSRQETLSEARTHSGTVRMRSRHPWQSPRARKRLAHAQRRTWRSRCDGGRGRKGSR